jgi:hypothetical protein
MFRALRLLLVPALTLVVAAAAWAGPACDSQKASTEEASVAPAASGCAAKTASAQADPSCVKSASASAGHCGAKTSQASQHADCVYCTFVDELKASKESVTVTTVPTEHGVRLVFAGATADDVKAAQTVASKAFTMVNAPAHCDMSRAKMASECCAGCKTGLAAFANAKISIENTDNGAEALISVQDDKQVDEVVAFFATFQTTEESPKG